MRGAVANGSDHEKMIFVEPIPNEVRQYLSSQLAYIDRPATSFAHPRGHQNTSLPIWSLRPTGR